MFAKAVLVRVKIAEVVKIVHDLRVDDMFEYFTWNACQRDGSVI